MYGDVTRLKHIGSGDPSGSPMSKNEFQAVLGLRPKRNPAVLFSRMKRMSPLIRKFGEALNSGNGGRREWATSRLAHLGHRSDTLLSLTILHGEPMARAAAAEAVCKMIKLGLTDSYTRELSTALDDDSPYVRWRALSEIGKAGRRVVRLTKELFSGLHDDSDLVRAQAAKAVAATYRVPRKSYQEDISDLRGLIKTEKDNYVRGEMGLALVRLEKEYGRFGAKFLKTIGFKV